MQTEYKMKINCCVWKQVEVIKNPDNETDVSSLIMLDNDGNLRDKTTPLAEIRPFCLTLGDPPLSTAEKKISSLNRWKPLTGFDLRSHGNICCT